MLHGRGWETVLVHEELQWGLVPDSFAEHVIQRTKWVSDPQCFLGTPFDPEFSVAGCWGTAELHYSPVVYRQPLATANGSVPAGSRHPVLNVSVDKHVRKAASSLRATPLSPQQADNGGPYWSQGFTAALDWLTRSHDIWKPPP